MNSLEDMAFPQQNKDENSLFIVPEKMKNHTPDKKTQQVLSNPFFKNLIGQIY